MIFGVTGISVSTGGDIVGVPKRREELQATAGSLGDAVFHSVSTAIVDGTLKPGEHLRPTDLERWLGVSRTPIRDALSRLTAVGLVESQPGRYTRVTRFEKALAKDSREYAGFLGGAAVRLAVARMSDDQLVFSIRLLDKLVAAEASGDDDAVFTAHRQFTDHACAHTGNRLFSHLATELGTLTERSLRKELDSSKSGSQLRSAYARLRDAVANRDSEYAEYAFRVIHRLSAEFDVVEPSSGTDADPRIPHETTWSSGAGAS